jgi:hypothetical protein
MAVNKNFVVKNGFEVNTNLIYADATTDKVGIGSTVPQHTLDVLGGIGATDLRVTGIATVLNELRVGTGGTVFTIIAGPTGVGQSVGVGTSAPAYLLDVRSPVSTGQTALYVKGDVRITGDLYVDDIEFDDASLSNLTVTDTLLVGGISTFVGLSTFQDYVYIQDGLNISGVTTISNTTNSTTFNDGALVIDGGLGVEKNVNIGGNLDVTGNITIGGSFFSLQSQEVIISNKDIILGYTTTITPNDDTANHAGVAIASTEGSPLVSFSASGINTLPDTYKQMMWFRSGTLGFSTDIFGLNYGLAIGTTTVANGVRLAVGSDVTVTDTTINAVNANISNRINAGITSTINLQVTGVSTLGTVQISSGVVTATSGIVTYYGDGSYLTGNARNLTATIGLGTTGGVVGYGVSFLDLRGPGLSTVFYNNNVGIATIYFQGGSGSASIGIGTTPGDAFVGVVTSGNLWYNSNLGRLFIYYQDVDSEQWVDASPSNVGVITSLINVSFAPGSAVSPSMYFVGDQQTGFFSPGAGQFTVVSTGSSVLNINPSGIRVTGVATATDFDSLSDKNYKENVTTVNNALLKVDQLRGVKFNWKESGLPSYGVIAQELEEVLPELVHGEDPKTVNYNGIIGVLIEAIKELKAEVEELKNTK